MGWGWDTHPLKALTILNPTEPSDARIHRPQSPPSLRSGRGVGGGGGGGGKGGGGDHTLFWSAMNFLVSLWGTERCALLGEEGGSA